MPAAEFVACLHGAAHLRSAGGERVAIERKQALLLAYLWIEGPTPRGKLAGLLWPAAAEARARGNLRQRLSILRHATGVDLVEDERGVLALSARLAVEPLSGSSAPLLATFDYDDCEECATWLEGRRDAQRSTQRAGLLGDVRKAVQHARLDEALDLADQLLGLDRESEEAYRTQMEVLYLRGDTAAAIAVWDRCKEMLRQLYGVAPSATTRQLGETILSAQASAVSAPRAAPDAIPVTVLRPPRLIGREPLLRALVASWRAARTLCVSGESGLGKSRLLAEVAARIGACAVASARPGDALVPYASLSRLLLAAIDRFEPVLTGNNALQAARLLPRLAALLPGEPPAAVQTDHERRECLRALGRLFAECVTRGCSALVFDDLQFADAASVEAVVELADDSAAKAVAHELRFVFGVRGDELTETSAALLASLVDGERFMRVDLQPLDEVSVTELIDSLGLHGVTAADTASLAQRLWQQVGGNPAFVLESIKLLLSLGSATPALQAASASGSLPLAPDIVAVVERRIGLLSPQARHLAQLAAVAGENYSVPLAAAALACVPLALSEPLRELELRQVLYGRQFVHDVIAVAVKRTVARSVADFMHRFVAEYLLAQLGSEPARIAEHWEACGEDRRAGEAYRQAAQAAADASRPVEQCQLLDAAVTCLERAGASDTASDDVADALFDALEARQAISAAPDRGATRLARMERLEALARSDVQRLRALLCRQGREADHAHTDAVGVGLAAVQQALAIGQPGIACEFARSTAWRLAMVGDEAQAVQTLEAHRPWVMAHGTVLQRADFHGALAGVLGFCDHLLPAIDAARQAAVELRAAGHLAGLLPMLSNMGLLMHWRGELDEARAVLTQAAQLRDRIHGRGSALMIDLHLGAVLRDLGEYEAAERLLVAAIDELRAATDGTGDLRTDVVIGENHLAQLWLSIGQPARAIELLASDDAGLALRFRGRRLALRLRAARFQGRTEPGLLAQAQAIIDAHDSPFNRSVLELEVACHLPAEQAFAVHTRLLAERAPRERPGLLMHVAARAAESALTLGDRVQVRGHADHVRALLAVCAPFDIDRAEVWCIVADVLRAQGESGPADDVTRRAAAWLHATLQSGLSPGWRAGFVQARPANARLLSL